MNKDKGFVLIQVMIFLLILTLLTVTSLEHQQLQIKMIANIHQYWHMLRETENVLSSLEQSLLNHEKIPMQSKINTSYFKRTQKWKQNIQKNTQGQTNGSYVIKKLTFDPCTQVKNAATIGSTYYRITVKAKGNLENLFLQSVIAVPALQTWTCEDKKIKIINKYRQSWRVYLK